MSRERIAPVRCSLCFFLALALTGCGKGGGGGSPGTYFTFETSAGTLLESDGPTDIEVVLHTTQAALAEDASVDVVDSAAGSATSGTDYAAFAPQTLLFPAGSVDGDVQTVALDPLDDLLVEGSTESVRLQLQNAVGAAISGLSQYTATLGDLQTAEVEFASAGSATASESGTESIALELHTDPGVTLGVAVSVRVSDLSTGSASSGTDYASFAPQTVIFAIGQGNGTVQTVDVTVQDDAMTEGDESVELGLSQPSAACVLGAVDVFVLTITDDEVGGNAAFLASEGATGTENTLAYDELISLGSQTVGAGPNAGTLLRVSNGGGMPMTLGAPSLTGTNNQDFALELESSSLGRPGPLAGHVLRAEASPLAPVEGDSGPGIALRMQPERLAALRGLHEVLLNDFVLPDLGTVSLELTRRPLPLTQDARLVIDGTDVPGGPRTLLGELQLWSGAVVGMPGSRVFLGLTESSANGFIELPFASDRLVHVSSDAAGEVRLVRDGALAALGIHAPDQVCAGELFVPGAPAPQALTQDPPGPSPLTLANCRLAIESDWQYFQKFGSSVLLTNYVTEQIAAISEQYVTDVQTTLSIAYLGIHTDSNDGWTSPDGPGTTIDVLNEFRGTWGSSWPASADLAHFFSGANLGGGVAYVNALCNQSFGFGVSGNLQGTVNWTVWTGNPGNFTWDFIVVAHELGHNFGTQHTHDYCPPLDHCYTNCDGFTNCPRGTLMSYCHACGGLSNIDLYFHPVTANVMRQGVNASCLGDAQFGPGEFMRWRLRFNPLTATGVRNGTLSFTHDAPNATQPFRVQLTGTAN